MKYNFTMQIKQRCIWIRLGALAFFSGLLIWTFIPPHQTVRITQIEWKDILALNYQNLENTAAQMGNPVISLEKMALMTDSLPQTIQLSTPDLVWYGSRSNIKLNIKGGENGLELSQTMSENENSNIFGTSPHLFLEADLDLSNLRVSPAAQIQQAWSDRGNLTLNWDINAAMEEGEHDGMIWIYGYLRDDEKNQDKRLILSAQHFTITVKRLFGLSMPALRWLGGGGILLSLLWLLEAWLQNKLKIIKSLSQIQ